MFSPPAFLSSECPRNKAVGLFVDGHTGLRQICCHWLAKVAVGSMYQCIQKLTSIHSSTAGLAVSVACSSSPRSSETIYLIHVGQQYKKSSGVLAVVHVVGNPPVPIARTPYAAWVGVRISGVVNKGFPASAAASVTDLRIKWHVHARDKLTVCGCDLMWISPTTHS